MPEWLVTALIALGTAGATAIGILLRLTRADVNRERDVTDAMRQALEAKAAVSALEPRVSALETRHEVQMAKMDAGFNAIDSRFTALKAVLDEVRDDVRALRAR